MKRYLPLLLALLSSCSLRQYTLVVVEPVTLYGEKGVGASPVGEATVSDTITVVTKNRKEPENPTEAFYKSRKYWTTGISRRTKPIRHSRLGRKAYRQSYALYTFTDTHSELARGRTSYKASTSKPYGSTPSTGATIYTGPRGGRYYINSKGNKVYIKSETSHSSRSSARRSSSSSYHKSSGSSYGKSSGSSYRRSSGSSYRRK